eukprot:TRINITY_DN27128_c0_g1_i1.p1 TRINITY_DN27128_c0_g1~~TRINITY_DN27128_c0_g1_i1.p1  ORF type:complete len:595 (+),score=86.02 TRINITY_DN27128_c0_g1_i1:67-1851(+)
MSDSRRSYLLAQRTLAAESFDSLSRESISSGRFELQCSCRRMVESCLRFPAWSATLLIATVGDAILTFATGSSDRGGVSLHEWLVLVLFTVDLVLNLFIYGRIYVLNLSGIFDFFLVVGLDALAIISATEAEECSIFIDGIVIGTISSCAAKLRYLRLIRLVRLLKPISSFTLCHCSRHLVSQNKRRYIDPGNNFDLDLTYIVKEDEEDVIAMGLPAELCKSCNTSNGLFRNPVSEVARFFAMKYSDKQYMIVNACPEAPYDRHYFQKAHFYDVCTQDQTPPTLLQVVSFLKEVHCKFKDNQSDPSVALAVHCKAGMGRTGTLIVAWLMYRFALKYNSNQGAAQSGQFGHHTITDADDALKHFEIARTRLYAKCISKKFMGVETPSQKRYLNEYLDKLLVGLDRYEDRDCGKLLENLNGECNTKTARLIKIKFKDMWAGKKQIVVAVHQFHQSRREGWIQAGYETIQNPEHEPNELKQHHQVRFLQAQECEAAQESEIVFPDGLRVSHDTRLSVFDVEKLPHEDRRQREFFGWPFKKKGGEEPGCMFFFFFHVGFLLPESGSLNLQRKHIDKACKKRGEEKGEITLEYDLLAYP